MKRLMYAFVALLVLTACEVQNQVVDLESLEPKLIPSTYPFPEGVYTVSFNDTDKVEGPIAYTVDRYFRNDSLFTYIYKNGTLQTLDIFTLGDCFQVDTMSVYAYEVEFEGSFIGSYYVYREGDDYIAYADLYIRNYLHEIRNYDDFIKLCDVYTKKE